MADLQRKLRVVFESYPQLSSLLRSPIVINDSSLSNSLVSQLLSPEHEGDDVYRVVFKKGAARELMTIRSGPLAGLSTSIAIEHGKISSHAGLKKIEKNEWLGLLPTILNLSYLSAVRSQIQALSTIVGDIRNQQILEEQARFERITDSIFECVEVIPNIALDNNLRSSYLGKIFGNYQDCFELFFIQKEKFRVLESSEPAPSIAAYNFLYSLEPSKSFDPATFFESQLLNSPVFPVFERLVACKVCEMLIVGDYSEEAINRYRRSLSKPIAQVREILQRRLNAFKLLSAACDGGYIKNYHFSDVTARQLVEHKEYVERIERRLNYLLEEKLKSFEIAKLISSKEDIELFLVNGLLILNSGEV